MKPPPCACHAPGAVEEAVEPLAGGDGARVRQQTLLDDRVIAERCPLLRAASAPGA